METIQISRIETIHADLKAILACRSKDQSRVNIQGVLVDKGNLETRFVTTDGFTMAILETERETDVMGYYTVLAETKDGITLALDTEGMTFPDYKQVLPDYSTMKQKKEGVTCGNGKGGESFSYFATTVIRMLPDSVTVNLDLLKRVFIPGQTYTVFADGPGPLAFVNCTKTFILMPMRA